MERNFRFIKPGWESDIEKNLKEEYGNALNDSVIGELSREPEQVDSLEEEFALILDARELMRRVFFKDKDIQNVHMAVNIQRIIESLLKESMNIPYMQPQQQQ